MGRDLHRVDFALDEMPGPELHEVLHAFRERGPVAPARFLGLPAFVITGHAALTDAFLDTGCFPPHALPRRTVLRSPEALRVRLGRG